ncbi:hypothetical protein EYF80_046283 [Liparis tanakae]|uniref:Uncharacterized protein n=1 Tax=Liparis tanakae TaxID=230148 RepID=A0A4Z2FQU2_9TELE|nr:hypothetical protein EYF80_046283 [Liparis tanakae]
MEGISKEAWPSLETLSLGVSSALTRTLTPSAGLPSGPGLNCLRVSLEYLMSMSCLWTGVESSKVVCRLPSTLLTDAQMLTVPRKWSATSKGIIFPVTGFPKVYLCDSDTSELYVSVRESRRSQKAE